MEENKKKELYVNGLVLCDSIFLGRFYTCIIFPEMETIIDHNKVCNKLQLGDQLVFIVATCRGHWLKLLQH